MVTIYTFGYGLTKKEDFKERIASLRDSVSRLLVIDVRKADSYSRNGVWCSAGWGGILDVLDGELGIECQHWWLLSNPHGSTKTQLEKYRASILNTSREAGREFRNLVSAIKDDCKRYANFTYCFLCGERKPFTRSGSPNCHRVILADELAKRLGEEWCVEHIE